MEAPATDGCSVMLLSPSLHIQTLCRPLSVDGISSRSLEEPAEGDEEEEEDEGEHWPYEVQEGQPHTPDQEQFLKQHFETLASGAAPGVVRLVIAVSFVPSLPSRRGGPKAGHAQGGLPGGVWWCFWSVVLSLAGAQSGTRADRVSEHLFTIPVASAGPHSGTLPHSPSFPDLAVLPVGPILLGAA